LTVESSLFHLFALVLVPVDVDLWKNVIVTFDIEDDLGEVLGVVGLNGDGHLLDVVSGSLGDVGGHDSGLSGHWLGLRLGEGKLRGGFLVNRLLEDLDRVLAALKVGVVLEIRLLLGRLILADNLLLMLIRVIFVKSFRVML